MNEAKPAYEWKLSWGKTDKYLIGMLIGKEKYEQQKICFKVILLSNDNLLPRTKPNLAYKAPTSYAGDAEI